MHNVLMVYASILGISWLVFLFARTRNDETASRKLARIRVPIDDSRRGRSLPPEEDVEAPNLILWALLAAVLMLLLMAGLA